jgi:group I intron endonuclease
MNCGIYKITSPSGNCYIGSSIDIARRWKQHLGEISRNRHHSKALQSAFSKYGIDSMSFEVILECSVEELLIREQEAIDAHNPKYNILRIAGSSRGRKMSEDVKRKIGRATKERAKSKEYRKLLSDRGREFMSQDKNKARIAESNASRVCKEETREKHAKNSRERNSIGGGNFAKLDWEKVRSIRFKFSISDKSPIEKDRLAIKFNVTRKTINTILRGATWKE